jgi:hypothetical protein
MNSPDSFASLDFKSGRPSYTISELWIISTSKMDNLLLSKIHSNVFKSHSCSFAIACLTWEKINWYLINGDFSDDLVAVVFPEGLDFLLEFGNFLGHNLAKIGRLGWGESGRDGTA